MKLKMLRVSATFLTLLSALAPSTLAATTTTTLGISNVAPSFTAGPSDNGSSGTTPTNAGSNVTFTATATDSNGDQWYFAVCRTNAIVAGDDAAPTCASVPNTWAISGATNTGVGASITYTTLTGDAESNDWYAFACDKVAGGGSCSAMSNPDSPFKVNHRPAIGTVTAGASYGTNTSVDPGSGGSTALRVFTGFGSGEDHARSVVIQSDGKILVAGYALLASTYNDFALVRYNADFSLDTGFGSGGKVTTAIGSAYVDDRAHSVALQSDGKIVVAGSSHTGSNLMDLTVARYTSAGVLDTGFGTGGKTVTIFSGGFSAATSVAIQSDGKIVAGGLAWNGTNNDFALARYNTDGSLDTGFDTDGKVTTAIGGGDDSANSVAVQIDGKIVIAGGSYNGSSYDFALARYNTDGSLDTGFDTDGKVTTDFAGSHERIYSIAIQTDGKIVGAGNNGADFALARYNTDGSLDTGFDTDGKVTTDFAGSSDGANSISIQVDGKIVAAGNSGFDIGLSRYNTDGSLDTAFDTDGKVTTTIGADSAGANSIAIQSDGKIVAAGDTDDSWPNYDFALVRYTTVGAVDTIAGNGSVYVRTAVTDTDTDTAADTIDLHVCSTNSFSGGACVATTLCFAAGIASGANADCTYTNGAPIPTAHGSYPIYVFLIDSHGFGDVGTSNTQSYSVTDVSPTIADSSAYSVTNITLTAGASTAKSYTVTVKDNNGDNDITAVTGVLYDDDAVNLATGTCVADENDCYPGSTCSLSDVGTGTDTDATATCGFTAWFNADYSANWRMHANPADETGAVTSLADSSAIATNAVQAINVPEATIAYGTVALGSPSSGVTITLENEGNQALDVLVQGTDMTRTGGGGTIAAGQQKWHNTTLDFTYASAGNVLVTDSASATTKTGGCADRNIAVRDVHTSGTGSDESLYLKLQIPSSQTAGSYTGTNTLAAAASTTCVDGETDPIYGDTVTYGGEDYLTVVIGTQTWFQRNLNIGTRIDGAGDQTDNSTVEKYCYDDSVANCTTYGGLYQWDEAMQYSVTEGTQGICPTGWHVPADADWGTLVTYLGGTSVAAGKMKELGTTHWSSPNVGTDNSSGFSAFGSGYRYTDGFFYGLNDEADFWTSLINGVTDAWEYYFYNNGETVWHDPWTRTIGMSVRCIQD